MCAQARRPQEDSALLERTARACHAQTAPAWARAHRGIAVLQVVIVRVLIVLVLVLVLVLIIPHTGG